MPAILADFAPVPNLPLADPSTSGPSTLPAQAVEPPLEVKPVERGGPGGPEPTRFGDWERNGRCIDF